MITSKTMDKDQSHMTRQIADLNLKIICLLTGEDYSVVKKTSSDPVTPNNGLQGMSSMTTERQEKKIQEVTRKMMELLTGEVPIRCQDVTVYFSMEEWDYLEGHQDLYKDIMMEDRLEFDDHINGSKRFEMKEMILNLALEVMELLVGQEYKLEKVPSTERYTSTEHNMPSRLSKHQSILAEPPSLQNEIQNESVVEATKKMMELLTQEVPIRCQDVTVYFSMEEWEYLEGHKDLYKDIMMEDEPDASRKRNPPQRCPQAMDSQHSSQEEDNGLHQDEDEELNFIKVEIKEEEEEMLVSEGQQSMEEQDESFLHIYTNGRYAGDRNASEGHYNFSPDYNDVTQRSPGVNPSTYNIHHTPFRLERSRDPSNPEERHTGESSVDETKDAPIQPIGYKHKRQFPCLECGKSFTEKRTLVRHQRNHTGERPYSCTECGKSFTDKMYLLMHQRSHTGERPFQCSECGKCFVQKGNLLKHQRIHTGVRPFSCAECGKSFSEKKTLLTHERSHTGDRPFPCSVCGKCFSAKGNLLRHERSHTGERPFSCEVCGKGFASKRGSIMHLKSHASERPFACEFCGKCFPLEGDLIQHRRIHTGDSPFTCSLCGKSFTTKGSLVKHQRLHTGKRPYACPECGKDFSVKGDLLQHQRSHTGDRPFSCPECGKSFTAKGSLLAHQRCHTGERPFSCSECGKCFGQQGHLLKHQTIHTGVRPFSCSECGSSFSVKADLLQHERIHTGERPYSCSECGSCFTAKGNLLKHQRSHTGERPYSCSECEKCFTVKENLLKHQQSHMT